MKFEYDKKLRELEIEAFALALKNGYEDYNDFWFFVENTGGGWTEDMSRIFSLHRQIDICKRLGKS